MISVAACAGDASAMAASAANCKNLKANFTVITLLCRAREMSARYALISPSGCGFNPLDITAAHNTS
jgi:hypothetical protein